MTVIETKRLNLEPVTTANAEVLWRIMQRPHLRQFQDVPRVDSAEFLRRVAGRPARFDGRLVRVRESGTPIGWVSLRVGEGTRGSAEIGYSIVAPARGRGYAREAAWGVVSSAFSRTQVARIEACCVPENAASRRLLAALGFTELRTQRSGAVVRRQAVDIVLYELTREAWAADSTPADVASAGQG
jgi:RimJ/RimL family protein N-acetyltransferase